MALRRKRRFRRFFRRGDSFLQSLLTVLVGEIGDLLQSLLTVLVGEIGEIGEIQEGDLTLPSIGEMQVGEMQESDLSLPSASFLTRRNENPVTFAPLCFDPRLSLAAI